MDRSDLYQQSSRERVNGFRENEQPSSQDQRESSEADPDAANPNDSFDKSQGLVNPDLIQGVDQRPQPAGQPSNGNNSMSEDSTGAGTSTDQPPPTGTVNIGEGETAEEEQHEYAPGFPKKMEVVVLALVRQTEDMDSDWVTELPKGTIVQVVEICGRRARITHPFPGWLSIRTGDGVTILTEPDGTVRVGARIVYKDFAKKSSIPGTVIDKDDRRSLHLVQFVDGRKEWLNLNCKEVEIVSTGRGEDITPQVSGATRLNYFADVFTPQTRGGPSGGGSRGGDGLGSGSGMGDSIGGSPQHPSGGPANRMGNGYPQSSHAPNGSARGGSRHRPYEDPYGQHRPPHARGGVPERVVDPRYSGAPYNRASGSWSMRGHEGAPPGLQGQGPPGHMGMNSRRGGGGGGGYYDEYGGGGDVRTYPTMDHREEEYHDRRQDAELPVPGPMADIAAREPDTRNNVKGFIVLRGLPGAGKTTLAKKLASRAPQSRICTEDRYHWTSGEDGVGEYKFKREVLFFARDWCNKEVKNSVRMGIDLVILDNCNARISMYEDLINHAVRHKYRFRIIEFIATPELVDRYAARSLKGFPREVYLKLLKLWERDPRAELINPCFDDDAQGQPAQGSSAAPTNAPPVVGPPPPMGAPGGPGPMGQSRHSRRGPPPDPRDAPPYYGHMESSGRGMGPPMMGGPPPPVGHGGHVPPSHHSSHRHHGGVPYDSGDHGGDYMQQHYY